MNSWSLGVYKRLRAQISDEVTIVRSNPVPESVAYPFIAFDGAVLASNEDTYDNTIDEISIDIFVYTDARSLVLGLKSNELIEKLADQIRRALNHYIDYEIDGRCVTFANAQPPVIAPTDDSVHGRVVNLTLRIEDI